MNYKITKQGRYGVITPIPTGRLATVLNSKMSYKKQGIEFMSNPIWGIIKLYNKDKGIFPWGFRKLVVDIFESWKQYSSGDDYEIDNQIYTFENIYYNDIQLRTYQKEAVKSFLQNQGGILCIPTGGGKTRMAIEIIKQLNVPTLVVVGTRDLHTQWSEQVDSNVTIKTYQGIKDYNILKEYKFVIYDECHHVSAKSLYKVAMRCPNAILLGLSATPYRTDGEDMKIEAALGKIIYTITRRELIDMGYLSDARVYYHEIPEDSFKYWLNYQDAYKGYIVNNESRNDKIIDLIQKELKEKNKILVLFSQIEHMDKIKERLDDSYTIYINGQMSKSKRKELVIDIKKRESCVVLASTIFDEGVDLPDINVLIIAAGGKSSIKVTQRVGRILRISDGKTHAIVHDMVDRCKWLYGHYKQRRNILSQDFEVVTDGESKQTRLWK